MFNLFNVSKEPKGLIAFYSLEDFWLNAFSEEERAYIVEIYQPMGTNETSSLITGSVVESSQTASMFLSTLAGWFDNPRDISIAIKLIRKAVELGQNGGKEQYIDLDYALSSAIIILYKLRDDEKILEEVINLCYSQISIAKEVFPKLLEFFNPSYNKNSFTPNTKIWDSNKQEHVLWKDYNKVKLEKIIPEHTGYTQLVIILKKQKKYSEIINLCEQAKKEGWAGDWDKRIDFAKKQLTKLNK
jgi:hypothetical protein